MAEQFVVRVPTDLAASVDGLVGGGTFASRSDAVRVGLELVVERERRAAVGRAIVAGYERVPQAADDDLAWTQALGTAMIAQEPW
ncbi:MAG: ribbon-helix-helix domain-containing protein [Solirubrobacteraceae bacterium]|jgi:Arc/MetJ-type ribon-helix-helix transcriptional regulator